jgi:signal transduction histidine kinase/ActR/RegA family two-component response regulator
LPELVDQPFFGQLRDVMATGTSFVGVEALARLDRNRDGQLHDTYYDYVYAPMRAADGEITGVLVFAVDVTQKLAIRHRLQAALEEARDANRAKDEFLALLGHELRNPLAPIVTALDLMQMHGYANVEREALVIQRQTEHLMRLVDDLMDVARIARSGVELRLERVELADVVAAAAELASPLFERKRHHLELDVAAGLAVHGDRQRLAQVFTNLLVNAAEYTEPGGRVHVVGRREGEHVVVTVADNGIGIAAEALPRVFDMFIQERRNTEAGRGGLGLGLAIVKSLVTQHGGAVSATSPGPKAGSTFEVRLPALSAMVEDSAAPTGSRPAIAAAGARRVLIVDDNEDAAQMLAEAIGALGHQIRVASDGPTALEIAPGFLPDLAVLDIGLPVMDGYQVASRLRELDRLHDMRLIAVSGFGQPSDRQRSQAHGFDAHLVKPVDLEHLASLFATLLDAPG